VLHLETTWRVTMVNVLIIFGQILTLGGAALGWRAVHVEEDRAIELGASRWVGDTKEERLKLPSVMNLLAQSKQGASAFAFIAGGTLFQIGGSVPASD
jgi:hypothetical protein